jgi:hypothetical protein
VAAADGVAARDRKADSLSRLSYASAAPRLCGIIRTPCNWAVERFFSGALRATHS